MVQREIGLFVRELYQPINNQTDKTMDKYFYAPREQLLKENIETVKARIRSRISNYENISTSHEPSSEIQIESSLSDDTSSIDVDLLSEDCCENCDACANKLTKNSYKITTEKSTLTNL